MDTTTLNETVAQSENPRAALDRGELEHVLTTEQVELYNRIPAEMDYVDHPSFSDPRTETDLYGENAQEIEIPRWTHFPEVPEDMPRGRKNKTALSGRDEVKLFLRYNYARCRLAQLIQAQSKRFSAARARMMVTWFERVLSARVDLVKANMALVLAMAKRTKIPNVEFTEMISEGNMALLRSVEKFDVARGFKFSTYACRAILKSFNRMATHTGKYHQRFPTEYDPDLETSDQDVTKHDIQRADSIDALREILLKNLANLSRVELTIVMERFAISSRGKGRTLAEVGKMVHLTNERVRQIQNLALQKIKDVLDDECLFVPARTSRDN
jgi:RNA polymerase primary sigma factor